MIEQKIIIKKTSELLEDEKKSLISLKQQHWGYSDDEQIRWFNENIQENDYHFFIYRNDLLIAYLDAVNVDIKINQSQYNMVGIGNVCVDKTYTNIGMGSILMACINSFLREKNMPGVLLCKDKLIHFYQTSSWTEIEFNKVLIKGQPFSHHVMFYNLWKPFSAKETVEVEFLRSF